MKCMIITGIQMKCAFCKTRHVIANLNLSISMICRCTENERSEAYLACSLATFKVQIAEAWRQYNLIVKVGRKQ